MMQSIALPLAEFTNAQKLELMELLWEDLSKTADAALSPEWHNDVLKERRKALMNGTTHHSDWEEAKERIRRKVAITFNQDKTNT